MLPLTRKDWSLVAWWTLATAAGWLVGFVACEALSQFLESLSTTADGLVIGTGVGIAQWLILRSSAPMSRWWILLTIVGFGIGKAIADAVVLSMPGAIGLLLSGIALGTLVGVAQWFVLQRRVETAAWWVAASAVAWGLAWSLALHSEGGEASVTGYLLGVAAAAIAGIVSGVALVILVRRRRGDVEAT